MKCFDFEGRSSKPELSHLSRPHGASGSTSGTAVLLTLSFRLTAAAPSLTTYMTWTDEAVNFSWNGARRLFTSWRQLSFWLNVFWAVVAHVITVQRPKHGFKENNRREHEKWFVFYLKLRGEKSSLTSFVSPASAAFNNAVWCSADWGWTDYLLLTRH